MEWLASVPVVAIYAVVGGVLGGLGGLLGAALERVGVRYARYLALIAAAASPALVKGLVLPAIEGARLASIVDSNPLIRAIEEELPDERGIREKLAEIGRGTKSAAEAGDRGFELTATIRKRYAVHLARAPDEAILTVVSGYRILLETIRDRESREFCAKVAGHGFDPADRRTPKFAPEAEQQGVRLIRAFGAALRTPVTARTAEAADWEAVLDQFLRDGGSDAEVELIGGSSTDNPGYCDAMIKFLGTVISAPAPAGPRVRLAFVEAIASG
jgi:hypothetical protein